jgi:ribosome-binding factor A
MSQRTERVDELLRQEIGALLAREVADPRIGFATITDVETSPDLRHAKVWVSVIGGKGERDETLRALGAAMPFIRHELGRRLRIKRIPELHVHLDDSAERGTRVLHMLDELERGVDPDAIAPINESLPTPVRRLPHEGDAEPDGEPPGGEPPGGHGVGGAAIPPVDPGEPAGRRPATRRGPGGRTGGRGAPPSRVPRRAPRRRTR